MVLERDRDAKKNKHMEILSLNVIYSAVPK